MKTIICLAVTLLNTLFYVLPGKYRSIKSTRFYLSRISSAKCNSIYLSGSRLSRSKITLQGIRNRIEVRDSILASTAVSVSGSNNEIVIDPKVILRDAIIHVRGNNCRIHIGRGSTFGGIRIVNAGTDVEINIGDGCLFADHIELWSSDTHTIRDEEKKRINPDKSVNIGDRVWVGSHVKILKGVRIGDDCVIGMGAIVTNDVTPNSISVGSPNRTTAQNITWALECQTD